MFNTVQRANIENLPLPCPKNYEQIRQDETFSLHPLAHQSLDAEIMGAIMQFLLKTWEIFR